MDYNVTLLSLVDWDPKRPPGIPFQDRCGKIKTGSAIFGQLCPRLLSSAFRYGVQLGWREGWGWLLFLYYRGHMCLGVGKGRFGFHIGKRGHGPVLYTIPGCWLPLPTPPGPAGAERIDSTVSVTWGWRPRHGPSCPCGVSPASSSWSLSGLARCVAGSPIPVTAEYPD